MGVLLFGIWTRTEPLFVATPLFFPWLCLILLSPGLLQCKPCRAELGLERRERRAGSTEPSLVLLSALAPEPFHGARVASCELASLGAWVSAFSAPRSHVLPCCCDYSRCSLHPCWFVLWLFLDRQISGISEGHPQAHVLLCLSESLCDF